MRPNILCICIDDLGAHDLGCTGSTFYETPHIDRLFADGLSCTRAYASCPVCSPTRASLLTGRAPARIGLTEFIGGANRGRLDLVPYLHYLPLTERSLPTALRVAGYQTWHVGKWHLGDEPFHPEQHGFDVNIGGCHHGQAPQGYIAPWGISTLPEQPAGTELTAHLTDRCLDLLHERDPDRPFYLNLWHYSVHTPIQAPAHLVDKYRAKARRLGLDRIDPYREGEFFPNEHFMDRRVCRRLLQSHPVYAAMIEHLDTQIGRLLLGLDEAGLRDETLVLFTSDNGGLSTFLKPPTCNLPLAEGKGWLEEGGIRVPQCLRWPGRIPAGSRSAVPTTSCDWFPTVLAAAGLPSEPEHHADGIDMLPTWTGGSAPPRRALFWHYPHYSNCGCRPGAAALSGDGRWKLVHDFEESRDLLFDLQRDPAESEDCSAAQPQRTSELRTQLSQWWREVQARFPEPNPAAPAQLLRPRVPDNARD